MVIEENITRLKIFCIQLFNVEKCKISGKIRRKQSKKCYISS